MTDTLDTVDGRSVLRVERRFDHPVDKVWRAISEPAHLFHWFPSDMEFDAKVGGKIRFLFRQGEGPSLDGVVIAYEPPRLFEYTWGDDSVLRFQLQPDGTGCQLLFTHTFADRPSAASFAAGWHICLDCLEAVVAGEPPDPGLSRWAGLHEGYVQSFGLDDGEVLDGPDGWEVRFERQLTRPPDEVWATLVAPSPPSVGDAPPPPVTAAAIESGPVTVIEPPSAIEYTWRFHDDDAGSVRWQLSDGNGGARLVVTQTVPKRLGDQRFALLDIWHDHIASLAKQLSS
jgi:uncharacterized protein YndB with AHSA1/START domain